MSPLKDRMNLIKATLAAQYPARVVTRSLLDFDMRDKAQLVSGIYTVTSLGESDYANYAGRAAMDGTHQMLLVGQFVLGEKALAEEIEDAEFVMAEEIKDFMRALPMGLCGLAMTGFRQSGQLERPYGWIAVDLEEMTE